MPTWKVTTYTELTKSWLRWPANRKIVVATVGSAPAAMPKTTITANMPIPVP